MGESECSGIDEVSHKDRFVKVLSANVQPKTTIRLRQYAKLDEN
jgi:hypothetical protein